MTKATKRTIVVGDVHGCIDELDALLDKLEFRERDRLIFVGDLINKGPDSKSVLQRVRDLGAEAVIGNHELGFIRYMAQKCEGNADFDRVRSQLGPNLEYWLSWMRSMPAFIATDDWIVVHAGLIPGREPSKEDIGILARIRTWDGTGNRLNDPGNPPWYRLYCGTRLVIYGHWAVQGLKVEANSIGLDTGCVYGGQLSAVTLPDRSIVQVDAHRMYKDPYKA